jgi:hypothetical protein
MFEKPKPAGRGGPRGADHRSKCQSGAVEANRPGYIAPSPSTGKLEADREQLATFVRTLFRHAGRDGCVSLRSFYVEDNKPFMFKSVKLQRGLDAVIMNAVDVATRAANNADKPVTFSPPLAVFTNPDRARELDLLRGLALSVECDRNAVFARARREALLGPATIVAASGGEWIDSGEAQPKLHLHWRLNQAAEGKAALAKLKRLRDLAHNLVDADTTNVPTVHPIRWPGSWHTKVAPKLSRIVDIDDACEIDLDAAFQILSDAEKQKANGKSNGKTDPFAEFAEEQEQTGPEQHAEEWGELIGQVLSGESYHHPLNQLAMKVLKAGKSDAAAVNMLSGLMTATTDRHDARWKTRYDDIPRAVKTARDKIGDAEAAERLHEKTKSGLMQTSGEFVADFTPPDYLIDGLMQRRYVYSFTGPTGSGKTAIILLFSLHVACGLSLARRDVEKGRVCIFAGENPDDVRTRWIKECEEMGVEPDDIDVVFMPFTLDLSAKKIRQQIDDEAAKRGPFSLLIVDTSAAYYSGDDENDNKKLGDHARLLRSFVNLPGGPTVLVTCHLTKTPNMENPIRCARLPWPRSGRRGRDCPTIVWDTAEIGQRPKNRARSPWGL